MSDFTPGPWVIDPLGLGTVGDVCNSDGSIAVAQAQQIASTIVDPKQSVRRANARLIAAAPDLLEALQGAVSEIEDLRGYANNHGGMIDDVRCDYGRAAIAKALGKEEV